MVSKFRNTRISANLIVSILIGISPVFVLHLLSENFRFNKNSFNRVFPPHIILKTSMIDVRSINNYIAGNASNTVYVGNYKKPCDLFVINMNLRDTHSIHLAFPDIQKFDLSQIIVNIDSPNIFITDKLMSSIFRCSIVPEDSFKLMKKYQFSSSESAVVSAESMVLRIFQENIQNNILAKVNFHHSPLIDSVNVLEKQIDGFFCTDGSLQIDHQTSRIMYTYFYRNQFICLDSNLRVIYKTKTIDTNSRSKIQVRTVHYQIVLAAPPVIVNKLACISGKSILINSALRADNEDPDEFKKNFVFDVYDSKDGHYRFSFYLPKINKDNISSLILQERQLFIMQGHSLIKYDLDL